VIVITGGVVSGVEEPDEDELGELGDKELEELGEDEFVSTSPPAPPPQALRSSESTKARTAVLDELKICVWL
jgi:hypothetical protein